MKKLILIPTDFSEVCNMAVAYGVEIAKYLNNNICLLHIIDKQTKNWLHKEHKTYKYIDEKLDQIAFSIKTEHKLIVQTMSREGNIFDDIAAVSNEIDPELIILGSHGKKGIQRITGSYALKVITRSPVPVMVVHRHKPITAFKKIVFPIDTSLATRQKVAWAVHIAKKYNSKIFLFQIRETSDELIQKLTTITQQISQIFDINKIGHQLEIAPREGSFAAQVNTYSKQIGADLITIMTNASEHLPYFTLGPWDEKIIFNKSNIPVMCINPHDYDYVVIED